MTTEVEVLYTRAQLRALLRAWAVFTLGFIQEHECAEGIDPSDFEYLTTFEAAGIPSTSAPLEVMIIYALDLGGGTLIVGPLGTEPLRITKLQRPPKGTDQFFSLSKQIGDEPYRPIAGRESVAELVDFIAGPAPSRPTLKLVQ